MSGYLGAGNLGDEALFAGMARGLAERGHTVEALSLRPAQTRRDHGVAAVHRLHGLPLALSRADAVVSGGGGLLQDVTSARSLGYYLGVVRAARLARARVVVFGQSIGPLSPEGRRRVARALVGLPIAVRDRPSQDLLGDLGLSSTLVADPALALPRPARAGPGEALLLIPRAGVPGATEALIRVAREARAAGERVAVLALESGEDEREADRIAGAADGAERWRADGPGQALARCAQASFVVSVRLHGLILATAARRGHVGVVYDPKVSGFLMESGGAAVSVPVAADDLVRRVRRREPLADDRRASLLARARHGLDWLDAAVRGGTPPTARHAPLMRDG